MLGYCCAADVGESPAFDTAAAEDDAGGPTCTPPVALPAEATPPAWGAWAASAAVGPLAYAAQGGTTDEDAAVYGALAVPR